MAVELEERFWAKVAWGGDGCWPWLAGVSDCGQGQFHLGGATVLAHRLAYELEVGSIPEGLVIDHMCHDPDVCKLGGECPHRRCCNPDHMDPVPPAANNAPGRAAHRNASSERTRCPQGHEYTPENTHINPSGGRVCRICSSVRSARAYRERKANR